jgi:hypothetical protein
MPKLTDDEISILKTVLQSFKLPENAIAFVFSSGKEQLVQKYFVARQDFTLHSTKKGSEFSYLLPFSSVKQVTQTTSEQLSQLREKLKPDAQKPLKTKLSGHELQPLRKGRGKGKKAALSRNSVTCLIDSSDVEKLNQLAATKDLSVSHLVRAAIKFYLANQV